MELPRSGNETKAGFMKGSLGSVQSESTTRRIERLRRESRQLQDDLAHILRKVRLQQKGRVEPKAGQAPAVLEILEALRDGFLLLDRSWHIRYLNSAAHRLLQALRPVASVVGKPLWDTFPELKETGLYQRLRASMATEGGVEFEEFLPSVHWWLEIQSEPLHQGLAVYFRDVTVRKQAEDLERARERQFRALFDQSPDAVAIIDEGRRFGLVNPAARRLFGLASKEIAGRPISQAGGLDPILTSERFWADLSAQGELKGECRILRADGTVGRAEYSAKARFLSTLHLLILHDVSERKLAEQHAHLQHSIASFLASLPSLRELRLRLGPAAGEASGWPAAAYWEPGEQDGVLACTQLWYRPPEVRLEFAKLCRESRIPRGEGLPGTVWAAGEPRTWDFRACPDPARPWAVSAGLLAAAGFPVIKGGEAVGVVELLSDEPLLPDPDLLQILQAVTRQIREFIEHKQMEEQRDILLVEERTARMQAENAAHVMETFLATVSHELRTPLTVILGHARLLGEREMKPGQQGASLQTIGRNVRVMCRMVDDLLDHSRVVSGKLSIDRREIDLAEIVQGAVDGARPAAAAKGVELQVEASGRLKVLGDALRLHQVVSNILSNSVKFTPAGGKITARLSRQGAQVQLEVSDTGAGIAPDFMPHVFEAFRQGEGPGNPYRGLGLGLALVREFTRLHEGTVEAESGGKGKGASFKVRLPSADHSTAAVKRLPPGREQEQRGGSLWGCRILVVDDDADTCDLLLITLRHSGATVQTVASTSQALEALPILRPNLLISDLSLPGEDGYTLIRRIRQLTSTPLSRIPAIALTGYGGPQDRENVMAAGFNVYLLKPIDPVELKAAAGSLLRAAREAVESG